jgi:hypothetical protein
MTQKYAQLTKNQLGYLAQLSGMGWLPGMLAGDQKWYPILDDQDAADRAIRDELNEQGVLRGKEIHPRFLSKLHTIIAPEIAYHSHYFPPDNRKVGVMTCRGDESLRVKTVGDQVRITSIATDELILEMVSSQPEWQGYPMHPISFAEENLEEGLSDPASKISKDWHTMRALLKQHRYGCGQFTATWRGDSGTMQQSTALMEISDVDGGRILTTETTTASGHKHLTLRSGTDGAVATELETLLWR